MKSWNIVDGTLLYRDEKGAVVSPLASCVYDLVFSGHSDVSGLVSPKESLPGIRFSRIGTRVRLSVRLDQATRRIACSVVVLRKGRTLDVTKLFLSGIDHAVDEGTWFFFSENFEEAKKLLGDAGIADVSSISYLSYVRLLNASRACPSVSIEDTFCGDVSKCIESKSSEAGLLANLYPYQETGRDWLRFITEEDCGCILGDEMGLGKTLQVIALLLSRKAKGVGPSIVIAPVSLLENWKREIEKFAPSLSVRINHGSTRTGFFKELMGYDVVIVSYAGVVSDGSMLGMLKWDLVVVDEAQNIKNPEASRTKAIKCLPRRSAIAISGTPFQNHITDIWSLVDFVLPGYLGPLADFKLRYSDDVVGASQVEPLLSPIMLRRLVKDVAKDLPKRVVITQPLRMTDYEAALYEDARAEIAGSAGGMARLVELSMLRMYCAHPSLYRKTRPDEPIKNCTKYERFAEVVSEIVGKGEKVIVFTSFVRMAEIMKGDVSWRFGIPVELINGSTPAVERQKIVDAFTAHSGSAMLVLNPQAAGAGLNITAANHVIHYNLEWNPALEDQASARAYRRGQTQTVFIHRFFYKDTVEEFVNDKIDDKRDMSEAAVIGSAGDMNSKEAYLEALRYSPVHGRIQDKLMV